MGLETGTYISDLVATNPLGTDAKSQGDNHLRLIKAAIKASFPNVNGAVNPTPAEFNHLVGVTGGLQAQLNLKATIVYVDAAIAALDAAKADDSAVVKLTGAQTVAGVKTLSSAPVLSAGLELGHASDTTLARIAAGRVSIEGDEIAKLASKNVFTNTGMRRDSPVLIENVNPDIAFFDTNAAADEKGWDILFNDGQMSLRSFTDAGAGAQAAIEIVRSGSAFANVKLHANGEQFRTQDRNVSPATTGAQVRHADGSLYDVGMNVMPWQVVNAALTFGREHVGKGIIHQETTARTWTTPPSTDTNLPLYGVINIINVGTGALTIAAGSGVTLFRFNGTGAAATGSRTLSQGGVATLWKAAATSWYIWGNAGLN